MTQIAQHKKAFFTMTMYKRHYARSNCRCEWSFNNHKTFTRGLHATFKRSPDFTILVLNAEVFTFHSPVGWIQNNNTAWNSMLDAALDRAQSGKASKRKHPEAEERKCQEIFFLFQTSCWSGCRTVSCCFFFWGAKTENFHAACAKIFSPFATSILWSFS